MKTTSVRKVTNAWATQVARVAVGVLLLAATGCGPRVGSINITPKQLSPGQMADVSVEVAGLSADSSLEWKATRGDFTKPTESATTYRAPIETGPVTITVTILSQGRKYTKSAVLDVAPPSSGAVVSTGAVPTVATAAAGASGPVGMTPPNLARPFDLELGGYIPSGFMGDGARSDVRSVETDPACTTNPHSGPTCQRWSYKPASDLWAAVAWQYPANNFGGDPGLNLSAGRFTRVTFFARGANGGEVVQFKAGGVTSPTNKFRASFFVEGPFITLTQQWQPYSLSLENKDLSNVVSAFSWVARAAENPNGLTFYLDDLRYE